jgi:hypothetical protein
MRILHTSKGLESPFEEGPRAEQRLTIGGSADYYGACSIETFCDAGGLTYTHDDAHGWLDYLDQFASINFWRGDGSVQPWIYYEDYDNWEDTHGADAVMAFYHSGHGGMRSDGIFEVPVGADWGGLGCRVFSNQMRLGNEQVRYLFWSTCESLRVLGGHSPVRTWSPANLGFRMLFGFETVSWDDPDYGKAFWQEWNNNNKSFSTAWMDASWYHVATDQSPSVVAVGATQAEAHDRVHNERNFFFSGVSPNWWSWRWYNAARGARAAREPNRALPRELVVAQLRPVEVSDREVREAVDRLGLEVPLPDEVAATPEGIFKVGDGDAQITFGGDGSFEARMAQPNLENRDQLPLRQARSAADEAITRHGLGEQAELTFDRVRLASTASASADGSEVVEPSVTETTVQYKQVINGLPVLTPEAGTVSVTLDNDGTVTGVRGSVRQVEQLVQPMNTTTSPPEPGNPAEEQIARPRATDAAGYEQLLAQEWGRRVASRWAVRGEMPLSFTDVPGSTEVGYDIRGNTANLVARKAIEVDFGGVLRKRYWVSVPLLE